MLQFNIYLFGQCPLKNALHVRKLVDRFHTDNENYNISAVVSHPPTNSCVFHLPSGPHLMPETVLLKF